MIRVLGIANCDTVRKARGWLDAHGIAYEFVDFKKTPPAREAIERWCERLGADTVVNRRGTTWRKLEAAVQARADTPAGAVALLLAHPSAIKRPVVESGNEVWVGFDEATFARRLGVHD